jgi:DNA polymerase
MNLTKKNQILNNLYKMKMVGYEYIKSPLLNTATNNISLPNNLTQLLQMVSNCDLCYYSNNKYTNHNFQDNISDIKVIFINLSPKLPISNKSLEMIENITTKVLNIDIKQIYITNILKCIPSKDISLSDEQLQICKPYLKQEIDIIQPKVIICLGQILSYIKDILKIDDLKHGVLQDYNNIKVVSIDHPSFLLRNPSKKVDNLNYLKQIKYFLEKN